MPTDFPTSLDDFLNPSASTEMDDVGYEHDEQHANINDAVEALEAKVGVNDSAVTTSLDYKNRHPLLTNYGEKVQTIAATGAAETIDLDNGMVVDATLDANCTFTFTPVGFNGGTGYNESFLLILRQDATGSRTVTWPASVKWPGGTAPTLSTAASAIDVLVFSTPDNGTTWFGNVVGQAYA